MLRTFGNFAWEGGTLRRPKPLLLLTYLALEGPKTRRYLAELFFPDARDPRDSLSAALKHAQKGGGSLVLTGERVSTDVLCDARLFRQRLEAGRYEEALALYRGPFLKELGLELSGELEEWLLETREHFASLARGVHLTLGEQALRVGDRGGALGHAERSYRLEDAPPLEEGEAKRLYRLLSRTESNLLGRLVREVAEFGLRFAPLPRPPHNLPTLLTGFVGREAERLALLDVLAESDGRLVTVHGPGGVGKTRLALEVAAESVRGPLFDDGVFFVALDAVTEPTGVLPAVAKVLGAEANEAALTRAVGDRRMLVVLDTLEHLLGAAPLLPRLLSVCPNLCLLVTTRERLNLKAEWVLTLSGLALPEAASDPERAALTEAVQLFSARAKRAQVTFAPGRSDLSAVVRICRAVGGFPLGLELAAAWVGTAPLEALADGLERDATALETPLADVRTRHRSVHAATEHSWRLLASEQQRLYKQLAVFRGGFTAEAAQRVADAGPEALKELVDKALLEPRGERYGFHALLYAFAQAKLGADPDLLRRSRDRHGRFYSEVLGRLNLEASGGASPELLAFMNREEGNLVAFLEWALETKRYTDLGALAEPLLWHLPMQGRFAEAVALCERVLAALPAAEPAARKARAAFLSSQGFLMYFADNAARSVKLTQEALELAEACGDPLQMLRALDTSGQAHTRLGDARTATRQMRRALALAESHGDPVRRLRILFNLGIALTDGDDLDEARAHLHRGLWLYRTSRVLKTMDAVTLFTVLGYARLAAEDYIGAAEALAESLEIAREIGSKGQQPMALGLKAMAELEGALLADRVAELGRLEAHCREVLPVLRAERVTLAQVAFLGVLARCHLEAGLIGEALPALAEAHELIRSSGNIVGFYWLLPHSLYAALVFGDAHLAGTLAGFTNVHPGANTWVRRRGERAVARWPFSPDMRETFSGAVAAGRDLAPEAVLERILGFMSPTAHPHRPGLS